MTKETNFVSPYLGPTYTKKENLNTIKKHKSIFRRILKSEKKLFYEDSTINKISDFLAQRKVICMYKGRSESGPRALGHRSIMCVPDSEHGRDYLNFKIKKNTFFTI